MGKKDKKKGKGAEKTALKTEKKALSKLKKELAAKGEEDIEVLIAKHQEQKPTKIGEELCAQPSPRSGFTLSPHPDKEELIFFGGEYFNGKQTTMFNDMYFYNLKKGQWSLMHTAEKPPPRSSHQCVVVSQQGGQMWMYGGEFASPTRSNFYHYKDLWVFHFAEKRWEQIKAPGAPSSRSGHRMVVSKKQIFVFAGFHETLGDYKYFNDLHIFDLETYTWTKLEAAGKVPSPRSGGLMASLSNGRILFYGGYNKEKVKKDVDRGVTHTDMYYLYKDVRTDKYKWLQVKPSGIPPSPRTGLSLAVSTNNQGFAFGGVHDEETDDALTSVFLNDLFILDMENGRWTPVTLRGGKTSKAGGVKKRRRREKDETDDGDETEEVVETLENASLKDVKATCHDDGIFTVTIGPSTSSGNPSSSSMDSNATNEIFFPPPRMSAAMTVKNGSLYIYGGICEEGSKQITLSDFYSLDFHKLDEWRTIVPYSTTQHEWMESESESDDDEDGDKEGEGEEEDSEDDDDESDDEDEMDTQ